MLDWHWQGVSPSQPASFTWWLGSAAPQVGLPFYVGQSPGAQQKLTVSLTTSLSGGRCPSSGPIKYTVTMFDSKNRTYTFAMQPST